MSGDYGGRALGPRGLRRSQDDKPDVDPLAFGIGTGADGAGQLNKVVISRFDRLLCYSIPFN